MNLQEFCASPKKWTTGAYARDRAGLPVIPGPACATACAIGAVAAHFDYAHVSPHISMYEALPMNPEHVWEQGGAPALSLFVFRMARVIAHEYPSRAASFHIDRFREGRLWQAASIVVSFNDNVHTTHQDVVRVMHKACPELFEPHKKQAPEPAEEPQEEAAEELVCV